MDEQDVKERMEPKPAASESGLPQVAPPMIPATVEQQRSSAVQYGGAAPGAMTPTDRSALLIGAAVILGSIVYMRSK
jgi:hypothetical protein